MFLYRLLDLDINFDNVIFRSFSSFWTEATIFFKKENLGGLNELQGYTKGLFLLMSYVVLDYEFE